MDAKGVRNVKVTLLYLHIVAKGYPEAPPPEYYLWYEKRFAETYRKHDPGYDAEMVVVWCGGDPDYSSHQIYHSVLGANSLYQGAGSDIGACQHVMKKVEADLVVCISTPVYFYRPNWLGRLVEAVKFFGDGLYGAFASYQNSPHIRTSFWAVNPKTFADYPELIDTREKCCCAESFRNAKVKFTISDWYASIGKPALLVTWDGVYGKTEFRKAPNIFRRGDQSNCLVWDQHCDAYMASHYQERCLLEKMADIDESCPVISPHPEKV